MKRCLDCHESFPSSESRCGACGWTPENRDGFPAYAPELAGGGDGGFDPQCFTELARLEAGHFWFRARNRLVIWALQQHGLDGPFLEIGCGTGYVLSGIAASFPKARLMGSELFTVGLAFAAARQPNLELLQMDARSIPFREEFSAIGAFDVLEHIHEDEAVLRESFQALRPGGLLLLTVPQHQWLWSPTDDYACHVRRYGAKELHRKVRQAGFEIIRSTSFVSTLLPAMIASRVAKRRSSGEKMNVASLLRISPTLNRVFELLLLTEVALVRKGIDLPVGGSRMIIARRAL